MGEVEKDLCLLVTVVIDQCRLVVQQTNDFGPLTAATNFGTTCGGVHITPCTTTAATDLALACTLQDVSCAVLGSSPVPGDPTHSNVQFRITWTELISGAVDGGTCTVTKTGLTRNVMLQLKTAPDYNCEIITSDCYCAGVYQPVNGTCNLVCNTAFCVEFEALKRKKRLIKNTQDCPVGLCDPPPHLVCPTVTVGEDA